MAVGKLFLSVAAASLPAAWAHIAFYHPSMYGWNFTDLNGQDFRPHIPLQQLHYDQWWWHGYLNYPPNEGDVFEFPAGGTARGELACNKGATSWWAQSEGSTDLKPNNWPCPGSPWNNALHATGPDDVTGCAIAVADIDDERAVKPEDFAIFTVNHKCPMTRDTFFDVPAEMPKCTGKYCHCAWFWIHSPNSGSEQMYMNAFRCKFTGTTSAARKIMKPKLARRCGKDVPNNKPADASNCTVGAKQPLYWYQLEGNNMFEGEYSPPLYNDLYDFKDGAQRDIFTDEQGPYEGNSNPPAAQTTKSSSTSTQAAAITSTTQAAAAVTSTTKAATTTSVAASTNPDTNANGNNNGDSEADAEDGASTSKTSSAAQTTTSKAAVAAAAQSTSTTPALSGTSGRTKTCTASRKKKRAVKRDTVAAAAAAPHGAHRTRRHRLARMLKLV